MFSGIIRNKSAIELKVCQYFSEEIEKQLFSVQIYSIWKC